MGSWRTFASWWAAHMFGPGQPLDIGKYFVIASDCIGAGKSSKPSDGLGMNFPKYRLADVVHAQKRLLAEALDVQELVAVIGISYGGRQTWQWGVQYPEAMRGLVPLISSPLRGPGGHLKKFINYVKQPYYLRCYECPHGLPEGKEEADGLK